MKEPDQHILLAKWLEGTLTEKEKIALSIDELEDLKTALNRLNNYGYQPMDETILFQKILKKRQSKKLKKTKIRSLPPVWLRAAASILLLIGVSFWWWKKNDGTVVLANNGKKIELTLPSQSEVVLNAGSELHYYEKEWQTERLMKLKGEAFFKVTKGVSFKVMSAHGAVEVLGTQFSVRDRSNTLKVVCYEGKVKVTSEKANILNILQKGAGIRVDENGLTTFKEDKLEPSWTKGISIIKKMHLSEVFAEIERQYNTTFQFSNVNLQKSFTGEFPHDNLEGALNRVCGAMSLKYEIKLDAKKVEIRPLNE